MVHFTEEEAAILKSAIENIDDTNLLKQNLKRKLYSVYDNKILADTVVKGKNASNVHSLLDAIEQKRQVVLRRYQSGHRGKVSDRRVEPFAFTTNYVQVWCFDTSDGVCKLFKTSRIGSVDILNEEWQHESAHTEAFIDIFRMNGKERTRVQLCLGMMAYNLLIEEYPLAERYTRQLDENHWLLDTEVASMHGVGRFVVGLLDDIRIIDSPELEAHIDSYMHKFSK